MTEILPLTSVPLESVKNFSDNEIGADYFSISELKDLRARSIFQEMCSSLVLVEKNKVIGMRLSLAPGQWVSGKGQSLSPHLWPHAKKETGYFQSLFVAQSFQNRGWGKKLSLASIELLKKMGARGVVCHSWVESPNNSSRKYLLSLQFKCLCLYPNYWKNVDYTCTRCGKPCVCSAEEMYLNLEEMVD